MFARFRRRSRAAPTGASSFHCPWVLPARTTGFTEAWATLEILDPPTVAHTYFWALQAGFAGPGARDHGAAHLGLQWYPPHPGSRAVNWGGYGPNGSLLPGTTSLLPSTTDDPNTRDYPWQAHRPYRLLITPSPHGAVGWRGTVTDLTTGHETVVRDLVVGGDRLVNLIVWTEVFAPCSAPSSAVRWSELGGRGVDGTPVGVATVTVNYQSHAAGGCANTASVAAPDGRGIIQRTNTSRSVRQGTRLSTR